MIIAGYRIATPWATPPHGRFRGVHVDSGRRVDIEIRGAHETDAIILAAHTLAAIGHRGVTRIVEHGQLPDLRTWFALEADGIALGDVMLRRTLDANEITALLRDAGDVLAAAHRAGVVHCGLHPDALHFGTGAHHAPVIIRGWDAMQAPGEIAGDYAAPELAGRFDGRADIYSLAVIAYRAFVGRFPDVDVTHVPNAPEPLSRLLVRMLAIDPERRPTAPEVRLIAGRMLERDRVTAPSPRTRWTPVSGIRAVHVADDEIIELVKS